MSQFLLDLYKNIHNTFSSLIDAVLLDKFYNFVCPDKKNPRFYIIVSFILPWKRGTFTSEKQKNCESHFYLFPSSSVVKGLLVFVY